MATISQMPCIVLAVALNLGLLLFIVCACVRVCVCVCVCVIFHCKSSMAVHKYWFPGPIFTQDQLWRRTQSKACNAGPHDQTSTSSLTIK